MVDKRRDPKAYTGLFEMIYKQNMPRIPPYLGINLSVRGRKILKNRSKQKQSVEVDEEEKERLNLRFKQREISKYELLKDKQIKQILPKLLAKDMHEGPVIEDLIDELKRTFKDNNESGVDFVPIVEKSASKRKSGQKNKTERVSNNVLKRTKSNINFLCRQRIKENLNKTTANLTKKLNKSDNSNYSSVFRDWSLKNCIKSERIKKNYLYEKETYSILKGKNIIFDKEIDMNKNYNLLCMNNSLPDISANCD